jgi:hypothetical protein
MRGFLGAQLFSTLRRRKRKASHCGKFAVHSTDTPKKVVDVIDEHIAQGSQHLCVLQDSMLE